MFRVKHLLIKILAIIILAGSSFTPVFGADITGIWKVDEEREKAFAIIHRGEQLIVKEHVYSDGKLKGMIGSGRGEKAPKASYFRVSISPVKKGKPSDRGPIKILEFIPLRDGITMRVHWIDPEAGQQGKYTLIKQSDRLDTKKDKKPKKNTYK